MIYPGQQSGAASSLAQSVAPPGPSLLTDSSQVCQMLAELHERLMKLGDHLLGAEPREASTKDAPEPMPSVHRNIARAQQIAQGCFEAIARIENRS